MIKVAIVDDDPITLEWLQGMAGGDDEMTAVGAAASVDDLIGSLAEVPDVVLLDVFLHNGTKLADNISRLRAWGAQVVVLSNDDRSHWMRRVALGKGALAFVNKKARFAGARSAIVSASAGELVLDAQTSKFILMEQVPLTQRQREIAAHIAAGLSNVEIAELEHLSKETVKEHVQAIKKAYLEADRQAGTRADLEVSLRDDGYQDEW